MPAHDIERLGDRSGSRTQDGEIDVRSSHETVLSRGVVRRRNTTRAARRSAASRSGRSDPAGRHARAGYYCCPEPGLSFQQGIQKDRRRYQCRRSIRTAANMADRSDAPATRDFSHETIDQHTRNGTSQAPPRVSSWLMFGASFRLPKARPENKRNVSSPDQRQNADQGQGPNCRNSAGRKPARSEKGPVRQPATAQRSCNSQRRQPAMAAAATRKTTAGT